MSSVLELQQAWEALPSPMRARMRCHARHQRERPDVLSASMDECMERACVAHRERSAFMRRLRTGFSGPRHLAHVLKITVPEAALILIQGPRSDKERAKLAAIMDGA